LFTPFVRELNIGGAREAIFGGEDCRSVADEKNSGRHLPIEYPLPSKRHANLRVEALEADNF
jgi:hypothetical protein